jgi:signal transduction histidine kinase
MTTLIEYIGRCSRVWRMTAALTLVVLIGVVDCLVSPRIVFTIFYLLPICLASWFVSARFGLVVCLLSDFASVADDFVAGRLADSHWMVHSWNVTVRLVIFLIFVWLLRALRSLHDRLEEVVQQRTAALTGEVEERKHLEMKLLESTERERQRIGQELHDGPCQLLAATALAASSLEGRLDNRLFPEATEVRAIAEHLRQAVSDCRHLAQGLFPSALETGGLRFALEQLTTGVEHSSSIQCRLLCNQELPPQVLSVALHLYRIAQEAVTNAVKHSGATAILVAVSQTDGEIVVLVKDNGSWHHVTGARHEGMGLRIIACRAELIGAALDVQPDGDGGTLVSCRLPCHESPTCLDGDESAHASQIFQEEEQGSHCR